MIHKNITFVAKCNSGKCKYVLDALTNNLLQLDADDLRIIEKIKLPFLSKLSFYACGYFPKIYLRGDWIHMFPDVSMRESASYNIIKKECIIHESFRTPYGIPIALPGFASGDYYIQIVTRPNAFFRVFDMKKRCFVDAQSIKPGLHEWIKMLQDKQVYYIHELDGFIYFSIIGDQHIYYFDWETERRGMIILPFVADSEMYGFACDKENYWMTFEKYGKVIRLSKDNPHDYEEIEIENYEHIFPLIDCGNYLLLCPWDKDHYKKILCLDKKKGTLRHLDSEALEKSVFFDDGRAELGAFSGYEIRNDTVRLFPAAINMYFDINVLSMEITGQEIDAGEAWNDFVIDSITNRYDGMPMEEVVIDRLFGYKPALDLFLNIVAKN